MGAKPSKINRLKCIDRHCHEINAKLDLIMNFIHIEKDTETRLFCHCGHCYHLKEKEYNKKSVMNESGNLTNTNFQGNSEFTSNHNTVLDKNEVCDNTHKNFTDLEVANCASIIRYVLKSEHNIQLSQELFSRTIDNLKFPGLIDEFHEFIERNYEDQIKLLKNQNKNPYCNIDGMIQLHLIGLGENPGIYIDTQSTCHTDSSNHGVSVSQIRTIPGMDKLMLLGFSDPMSRIASKKAFNTSSRELKLNRKSIDLASPNLLYFHVTHDPIYFRYSSIGCEEEDFERHWTKHTDSPLYIVNSSSDKVFSALWELELRLAFIAFIAGWNRNNSGVFDNVERIYCGLVYHHPISKSKTKQWSQCNIVDAQVFGKDSNLNTFLPNVYKIHQYKQFFLLKASPR